MVNSELVRGIAEDCNKMIDDSLKLGEKFNYKQTYKEEYEEAIKIKERLETEDMSLQLMFDAVNWNNEFSLLCARQPMADGTLKESVSDVSNKGNEILEKGIGILLDLEREGK